MSAEEPLGRLLAMALRLVIDDLHERLAERGWGEVRPLWGFVLLTIRAEPCAVSEIGRRLGVTKQAAAKIVHGLADHGLVEEQPHPTDRRAALVSLTDAGGRFLADAATGYADIEAEWAATIGARRVAGVRSGLAAILDARHPDGAPPIRPAL